MLFFKFLKLFWQINILLGFLLFILLIFSRIGRMVNCNGLLLFRVFFYCCCNFCFRVGNDWWSSTVFCLNGWKQLVDIQSGFGCVPFIVFLLPSWVVSPLSFLFGLPGGYRMMVVYMNPSPQKLIITYRQKRFTK